MNGLIAVLEKQEDASCRLNEVLGVGLKALAHRGANQWKNETVLPETEVCLGMASCSKQNDTSHIASHNGNLLFFDGRLLDRVEVAERLSVARRTQTETEAEFVLYLLENHGVECLKLLKGFWSLIYVDAGNKTIYGARDHFGNRPMWFCNTGRHFALASEGRTLYSMLDDVRRINRDTVIDFLLWGNIGVKDQYFFQDIHSIEPSHFVKYEIETGRLSVERYYTLRYSRSREPFEIKDVWSYADDIYRLMADSVEKNLQSFNGPVAIGLSGGMDSSSLAFLAQKTHPDKEVVAYTTTNDYDGGEIKWAEKVVRHIGMEWVKVLCTPQQLLDDLKQVNSIHSAPIYNASSFTQYRLLDEMAKDGHTVVLDGQGGDEMFGGYQNYFPLFLRSLRKNGEWKNGWNELTHVANSGMTTREMCTRMLKEWAKNHYYTPHRLAKKQRAFAYESLVPEVRDAYFKSLLPVSDIQKKVLNDMLYESYTLFLGNILRWGEHAAASKGIECIMPLSDNPELIEYVFSISSAFKIHDGWNKYMQRQAMVGVMPDEICWRKEKMGFYFPEQQWLNEIEGVMLDNMSNCDGEGILDMEYIIKQMNHKRNHSNLLVQQFLFRCYSYFVWKSGLDT